MAHEHLIGEGLSHRERALPLRSPFARQARFVPPESSSEVMAELPVVVVEVPVVAEEPAAVHRAAVHERPF